MHSESRMAEEQENTILDLKQLLALIKNNRRFVLVMSVSCFVLGLLFAFLKPPVYQSSALIEIKNGQDGMSNLVALLGNAPAASGSLFSRQASESDIETSLLQSRYILGQVIRQMGMNLVAYPRKVPLLGHVFGLLHRGNKPAASFLGLNAYAWGGESIKLAKLDVPQAQEGRAFTLKALPDSRYALYAPSGAFVLNGKVGELEHSKRAAFPVSIEVDSLVARLGSSFMVEKQEAGLMVDSILSRLQIQEQGQQTGILELDYQAKTPDQAQKILNTILAVAVTKNISEKSAEAAKTMAFLKKQMPDLDSQLSQAETAIANYGKKTGVVDQKLEAQVLLQNLNSLEQSLETVKQKKLELLQNFTPKHPYVIAISQQEKQLEAQINKIEGELKNAPAKNLALANMQRNLDVAGQLYQTTQVTMQQMQMLKGSTISDVRLLSSASYPAYEAPRKIPLIAFAGLFFGFVLAVLILVLRQLLSPNVENPEVIEAALQLPVLGVLPYSAAEARLQKDAKKIRLGVKAEKRFLLSEREPKNVAVESLRSLRTALGVMMVGRACPIIGVSGVSPAAGKSFISANLAFLLAGIGKRVLLVDLDMRKGHLNRYFNLQVAPGMAEYLNEQVSFQEVLHRNVAKGLDFVAAGERASHPAELLNQFDFSAFWKGLTAEYDYIIVDTPPVLAVSDPLLTLKHTTINLLVIGAGNDNLHQIRHTQKVFTKSEVALHGVVLNHVSKRTTEGHAGRYSYYYDYEDKKKS